MRSEWGEEQPQENTNGTAYGCAGQQSEGIRGGRGGYYYYRCCELSVLTDIGC